MALVQVVLGAVSTFLFAYSQGPMSSLSSILLAVLSPPFSPSLVATDAGNPGSLAGVGHMVIYSY